MIGVNTNASDPKKLKAIMDKEKLNWRSFGSRDVAVKWNASTPGYYVIDHKGVIRNKWMGNAGPGAKAIDTAVEKLIHEAEGSTGSENAPGPLDRSQKKPVAPAAVTSEQTERAIARGLDFLIKDVAAWRKEKTCATCHHGTMTVWALAEAKSRGHAVAADAYTDIVQWTKERFFTNLDKPRDTRPGWKMVSSPSLVLAVMAQNVAKQDAVTPPDLKRIAGHLLRHQEEDGSWAWSSAPPVNRPPPFFESDEVATLLAMMSLSPHEPDDPKEKSEIRDARQRGAAWLAKSKPSDTTQAAALRLLMKLRAAETAQALEPEIARFLSLQRKDGGWAQIAERDSDAYATGQALYVLSLAGVKSDRAEIQRGIAFLVATQKDDGAWPMTRRGHPGVTPGKYIVPITYFGSAWATLGLLRATPAKE